MGWSNLVATWQAFRQRSRVLDTPWQQLRFLVLDLELTGLDPKLHEIVSIGWVPIIDQRICPHEAGYVINREVSELAQSPVFHGIDHAGLATGDSLQSALAELAGLMNKSVLVFHNAPMDLGFLRQAFKNGDSVLRPEAVIDTLLMEKKRLARQGKEIAFDDLTLAACRARYGLPDYDGHNALTDALATAELLLAQLNQMSKGKPVALKEWV